MALKDFLELVLRFGSTWVFWAFAPFLAALTLCWLLQVIGIDIVSQARRLRYSQRGKWVVALSLTAYYSIFAYSYYNRRLPDRFEEGVIGILIAPVSGDAR